MRVKSLLDLIFGNEALTRGLGDAEARMLIEWLADQVEHLAEVSINEEAAASETRRLCRRGRAIARFIGLWCHDGEQGAAVQLAAAEGFTWPLPTQTRVDPCELMQAILLCESHSVAA